MKEQISQAQPWIIAALSLLLGLSIGQIQRQHRRIHELEHFAPHHIAIAPPMPAHDLADELRREREHLLHEKDRMLDELHREIERAREEARQ